MYNDDFRNLIIHKYGTILRCYYNTLNDYEEYYKTFLEVDLYGMIARSIYTSYKSRLKRMINNFEHNKRMILKTMYYNQLKKYFCDDIIFCIIQYII